MDTRTKTGNRTSFKMEPVIGAYRNCMQSEIKSEIEAGVGRAKGIVMESRH